MDFVFGVFVGICCCAFGATIYFCHIRNNAVYKFRGKILDLCRQWNNTHQDSKENAFYWCDDKIPDYDIMVKSFFEPLTLERWIPKDMLDRLLDKPSDEELVDGLRKLAKMCSALPEGHPDRVLFINLKQQMIRRGVEGAIDVEMDGGKS